jgi:hypothetical protein
MPEKTHDFPPYSETAQSVSVFVFLSSGRESPRFLLRNIWWVSEEAAIGPNGKKTGAVWNRLLNTTLPNTVRLFYGLFASERNNWSDAKYLLG